MTPKEITTLAHHRLVPPWVMKLVLEATAIERDKVLEEAAKLCDEHALMSTSQEGHTWSESCAAAIRGLK